MVGFLDCPYCSCTFLSKHDLDLHVACFGEKAVAHKRSVKREHNFLELFGIDYEIIKGRVVVPFNPNRVTFAFDSVIKDYLEFHLGVRGLSFNSKVDDVDTTVVGVDFKVRECPYVASVCWDLSLDCRLCMRFRKVFSYVDWAGFDTQTRFVQCRF
jgi:hypothetical protein